MARTLLAALVAALALFAVADAKLELTEQNNGILHNHILNLKASGAHLKEDVPEEIRGANMTVENLYKYFDTTLHVEITDNEGNPVSLQGVDPEMLEPPQKVQTTRKLLQDPRLEALIRLGKEIWKVVEDNAPVLNYQLTAQSTAVPEACKDNFLSMAGWRHQQTTQVSWKWVNGFGIEVVVFEYKWQWKSDGTCKIGSGAPYGKFLHGAGVAAKNVHVSWGYTCNVVGRTFSPYNVGTHESPIAAFDMEVEMRHSTILVDNVQHCRVNVRGDAGFRHISGC